MGADDLPEYGSLVTAILLILGLAFAGYWIYSYAGGTGQTLAPWFGIAAVAIVILGILNYVLFVGRPPRDR